MTTPVKRVKTGATNADHKKYVRMLEKHNWEYMFSDDHKEWSAGKVEWAEIESMQPKVDPDWIIFNSIAPIQYRVKL